MLRSVKGKKIIPSHIKETLRCIFRNIDNLKSFLLLKNNLTQYFQDYKDIRIRLSNVLNCVIIVTAYKIFENTKDKRPNSIYKLLRQLKAHPRIYGNKMLVEKKLGEIESKLTKTKECQRKIATLRNKMWAHQEYERFYSDLSRKELGECIKISSGIIKDIIQLLISDGFNLPNEYSPFTYDKAYKEFRGLVKCALKQPKKGCNGKISGV